MVRLNPEAPRNQGVTDEDEGGKAHDENKSFAEAAYPQMDTR